MEAKRLRMFAGPNGSGKSTVFWEIHRKFNFELGEYLNADDIEKKIRENNKIHLQEYGVSPQCGEEFEPFIKGHSLLEKATSSGYKLDMKFIDGTLVNLNNGTHSYEASIVVDFLRNQLLESGKKFTFETVMSHPSKVDVLEHAKSQGYKNYLYFISTESVEINKSRVIERVKRGGHPVPEEKIEKRYYRSLNLLRDAVRHSYRAFIFDNSEDKSKLVLDVYKGSEVTYRQEQIPMWVDKYLLQ